MSAVLTGPRTVLPCRSGARQLHLGSSVAANEEGRRMGDACMGAGAGAEVSDVRGGVSRPSDRPGNLDGDSGVVEAGCHWSVRGGAWAAYGEGGSRTCRETVNSRSDHLF